MDHINVSIAGSMITITPDPLGWTGTDHVTLRATDPEGLYDTKIITIRVENINHAPEIIRVTPDINPLILMVGEERTFSHISIDEDNNILESYWKINSSLVKRSNFSYTPSESGNQTLTLYVSDGRINATYEWTIVAVEQNSMPILLKDIPDQEWMINTNFTDALDLDDYFSDPEGTRLVYTYEGNDNIEIVQDWATKKISFHPRKGWRGTETVRFIADDGSLIMKSNDVQLIVSSSGWIPPDDLPPDDAPPDPRCIEMWNCTRWVPPECPRDKMQTRECYDLNRCGTEERKPEERRTCRYLPRNTGEINLTTNITNVVVLSPFDPVKQPAIITFITSIFILGGLIGLVATEKIKARKKLEKEKKSTRVGDSSFLRLLDYIIKELQSGLSKEKIRNKLLYEGWNEYIIEKAFMEADSIMENKEEGNESRGIESIVEKSISDKVREKMKSFE
jgi:hypothetical protein